ncbi:MAG: protein phosphatase CheZ [Deltaproteobacteria bacterium]|jgi:chemotaxis protein CheZ|nr:protein phosphatase CheZ [Deltaproteobacteria bacterium]
MRENAKGHKAGDFERLMREKEFHRRLNEAMLQELQNIYKEITKLTESSGRGPSDDIEEGAATIFHEASRQLEEVMNTTLRAADDIMNRAEALQENGAKMRCGLEGLKAGDSAARDLLGLLALNMEHVNAIVEALSFQDLTGQRLKKVVNALGSIRQIVVQTYVSAGLMLKKSEEEPEKDLSLIVEESEKTAAEAVAQGSKLVGPSSRSSQKDVDNLLAQLGL